MRSAVGAGVEGVAANGGYDAGGWGYYADAVAWKIGSVLLAGCVAGVEGEGKDVETECCAKSVKPLRAATITCPGLQSGLQHDPNRPEDVLKVDADSR